MTINKKWIFRIALFLIIALAIGACVFVIVYNSGSKGGKGGNAVTPEIPKEHNTHTLIDHVYNNDTTCSEDGARFAEPKILV